MIAEFKQDAKIAEGANGLALFVRPAKVDDETARRLQGRKRRLPELAKPVHIFALVLVAIGLLTKKRERRARHDQVHGLMVKLLQDVAAVSADLKAARSAIDVAGFGKSRECAS